MHYIDVHCHIVPGVDDGAKTLADSQKMLQIAWEEGIREIIATPHYAPGYYMVERSAYDPAYEQLAAWQREALPEMKLYRGNEVCLGKGDVSDAIYRKTIFPMAGSSYLLVEFDVDVPLERMKKELYRVTNMGFWPILAHVERYRCLYGWRMDGEVQKLAYFQVNAASILGEHGSRERNFVKKLLKKDQIHFVATDAHGAGHRSPRLREAGLWLRETFGEERERRLLFENPGKVIAGEKI